MTSESRIVRAATAEEWEEAARLQQLTNPSAWTAAQWMSARESTTNTLWLTLRGAEAVAFLLESTVLDELEVLDMGVSGAHRRQGLAAQLLLEVLDSARTRDVRSVHLEVRVGNEPARRLYESVGMRQSGLRRAYYRNPVEDAVLMHLDLVGKS